mmetsp:Transcript_35139/g.61568  ORF Transcript_35139/g.61568 Transcript_35139/m.61568 type:complete len:90 (-) Transcript_35139:106-375(-)
MTNNLIRHDALHCWMGQAQSSSDVQRMSNSTSDTNGNTPMNSEGHGKLVAHAAQEELMPCMLLKTSSTLLCDISFGAQHHFLSSAWLRC